MNCIAVEELARAWAPLIWLHSEELFYPSSVEYFLPEVTIQNEAGEVIAENPTAGDIPGWNDSSDLHMQTREALGKPFFLFISHLPQISVSIYDSIDLSNEQNVLPV